MSSFLVNRDTIDLLVTAVTMGRIPHDREPVDLPPAAAVRQADHIGRLLWSMNHAAVNRRYGTDTQPPDYEWRPVLELIGQITPEQLVQIEKSRRTLAAQCEDHPDWGTSPARRLLDALERAIAQALHAWPRESLPDGVAQPVGLNAALTVWSREAGLPTPHAHDDATS